MLTDREAPTAIAAGGTHSLLLLPDSQIASFGDGANGRLGNATTLDADTPSTVVSWNATPGQVSAGYDHSLALKSDGAVWAFGANASGQLGNGTTTDSSTPVQVSNLTGIVQVAAGDGFSVALKSDGTVWAWGTTPGESWDRPLPPTSTRPNRSRT